MTRRIIKEGIAVVGAAAVFVASTVSSFAGSTFVPSGVAQTSSLTQTGGITTFLSGVLNLLIGIAGFLVLVYLVISGVKYITSGGDAQKTESARKSIIAALIGIVVVLLSYILVRLVLNVFAPGVGLTNDVVLPNLTAK